MFILEQLKTMAIAFHKLFIFTLSEVLYFVSLVMLLSAVWCYTPIKSNDTGFNSLNPVSCQGVFNSNREIMANLDFLHEGLKIHVCFHVREKRVISVVSFKFIVPKSKMST